VPDERCAHVRLIPPAGRRARLAPVSSFDDVLEVWRDVFGQVSVGLDDDFFDLGGDSLVAVALMDEIERVTGVAVDPGQLLEHSTPRATAHLVESSRAQAADRLLVRVQSGAGRMPLFAVYDGSGDSHYARALGARLGLDRPVLAFEAVARHAPSISLSKLAEIYTGAVISHQAKGPYHLYGSSFGGLVAFEMAILLAARDSEVRLFIGNAPPPDAVKGRVEAIRGIVPPDPFVVRARAQVRRLIDADLADKPAEVRRLARDAKALPGLLRWRLSAAERERRRSDLSPATAEMLRRHRRIAAAHEFSPCFRGDATLFCVGDAASEGTAWSRFVDGPFRTVPVPGTHVELHREPSLSLIAEVVRAGFSDA
jgi:thioesterase domain-containing protein/acyl carrier protein